MRAYDILFRDVHIAGNLLYPKVLSDQKLSGFNENIPGVSFFKDAKKYFIPSLLSENREQKKEKVTLPALLRIKLIWLGSTI